MQNNLLITSVSRIRKGNLWKNSDLIFAEENAENFSNFIKAAFKSLNVAYPKFYKMDNMCKLGFVASEVLLANRKLADEYKKEDIGLILLNRTSTINTDKDHQLTIDSRQNYFPSPAIFVYTLPNIVIGEICIRNGFFGENLLLISDNFDKDLLVKQTELLIGNGKASVVIAGWLDVCDDDYEADFFLIESVNDDEQLKVFSNFAPRNL